MNKLKPFNKKRIAAIAKKYGLTFVILFGSKARLERANPETDLDIAVLAKSNPDYKLFGRLYREFSDVFKGENVDVRFLNGTDLLFRHSVVRDGLLLYGDEKKYLEYKLLTIKRYVDDGKKYFPVLDEKIKNNLKFLEGSLNA